LKTHEEALKQISDDERRSPKEREAAKRQLALSSGVAPSNDDLLEQLLAGTIEMAPDYGGYGPNDYHPTLGYVRFPKPKDGVPEIEVSPDVRKAARALSLRSLHLLGFVHQPDHYREQLNLLQTIHATTRSEIVRNAAVEVMRYYMSDRNDDFRALAVEAFGSIVGSATEST
jgi:hypothetical protein